MASGRTASVVFLGNSSQLNAELARVEAKLAALSRTAEDQNAKMAASSEMAGKRLGTAFDEGTTKAGGALQKLSQLGASFGLPMVGSLDAVGKKLDETHTKTGKLTESLAALGKVTLVGGLAGFAAAAYEGVKAGEKFQTSTAAMAASAGISEKAATNLGKAFLATAGHSTFSGQTMASSYAQVAGQLRLTEGQALSTAQATQVMEAASKLAEASQIDLGTATSSLANVMQAYHLGVNQAVGASNTLFTTSKALGIPVDQVAQAVDRLHGRLGRIAPSLTDTAALMAEMAQHGITGSRGLLAVNSAFQTMLGSTPKVHALLQALGVSLYDQQGHFIGLQGAIAQLQPKLQGLTQQQQIYVAQTLFGKSAGQAMLGVILSGNAAYQQATAAVQRHNAVSQAAHAQTQTLHGQMETLKATVSDLAVKFGTFLIPKLEATAHAISDVIGWFGRHKAAAEALAGVIVGVLGAAVTTFAVGKAAAFIGGIRSMIGAMGLMGSAAKVTAGEVDVALGSTGIGAIMIALGIAATEMGSHWGNVMSNMKDAVNAMVTFADQVLNNLIDSLNTMIGVFNATIGQLTGSIGTISHVGVGGPFGSSMPYGKADTASMGGSVSDWTGSENQNAKLIAGQLRNAGLSKAGIAALIGNWMQESQLNPMANGGGLAQWIGSRGVAEFNYANSRKLIPHALPTEVGFAITELMTKYPALWKELQHGGDPAALALAVSQQYERPGKPNNPARERYAQQMFAALGGSVAAGGGGGGSGAASYDSGNAAIQKLLSAAQSGKTGSAHHRHLAAATATIPAAVVTMLSTAQALVGASYTWGGGHSGFDPVETLKKIGVDCSGFVSAVLHSGGVRMPGPLTTQGLPGVLAPGQGLVTVWDRHTGAMDQQHTLIDIMGKWFESGGKASPGGVSQISAKQGAQELAGGGFQAYHPILGAPYATAAQLRAAGLSAGFNVANAGFSLAQLEQAFTAALLKSADALAQKLGTAIQTGTLKTLENVLGVSTTGSLVTGYSGRGRRRHPIHQAVSAVLSGEVEGIPGLSSGSEASTTAFLHGIDVKLGATVNKLWGGSGQGQQFNSMIAQLLADGQKAEAEKLLAVHKAALATLAQELYAQQVLKDGEVLNLQATQLKDQTQLQANTDAAQLDVVKATQQKTTDALSAQVTSIRDMTQIVTDRFSAMAQRVEDSIQQMADSANAVVSGINDQTQIQVDVLGERGLYGLNLVAQKLQVQSDETKAYWDQQIALAQQSLDTTTATENAAVQAAQLNLDQVTAAQDQLVALQQQTDDTAHIKAAQMIAAAQAHADAVTLHYDTAVVGPAQMAVDLNATAPKSQQDVLNAVLRRAQGQAGLAEARAGANLEAQTNAANKLANAADYQYAQAQATAAIQEAGAQQTLATIQGEASYTIAQAKQGLQGVQDSANIAEAQSGSAVSVARARAQTEFAGTGTVINVYGVPLDNATAISSELSWAARTMLP